LAGLTLLLCLAPPLVRNFPRFDVKPNTGEPLNANRRWRIANNTAYLDAKRPLRIALPVVP
jgi:predicted acyl esterase